MRKVPFLTLATIVGARPQFVKAAAFSRVWRRRQREILIHTGQHYDPDMSAVFFRELDLPKPDYHLGIHGHGSMGSLGRMLGALETLLTRIKPDGVLVYGDTNTTLAGALTGAHLHLPVFHVEAGLRSYVRNMPEEINRVAVDHLSDLLFAPTHTAVQNLYREGLQKPVVRVGDIMYDAFRYYRSRWQQDSLLDPSQTPFAFMTVHRAATTDNPTALASVCEAAGSLPIQVLWPLHPRTRLALRYAKIRLRKNIRVLKPLGYLECLRIQSQATVILTDSGGVQKEAYFLRKPCVTLRDETEWTDTLKTEHNVIGGLRPLSVRYAFHRALSRQNSPWPPLFGNGRTAERISDHITAYLQQKGRI